MKLDERFISWASFIESLLFDLENFQIRGLGKVGKCSFRSERGEGRIMKTYHKRQELPSDFFPSEEPNAATSRDMLGTSHPDTESSLQCYIHCHTHDEHTYMHTHENGAKL